MKTTHQIFTLGLWFGVVLPLVMTQAAWADQDKLARSLAVTGSGKVMAKPDMATLSAGVVTQAPTAATALTQNSKKMRLSIYKLLDIQ